MASNPFGQPLAEGESGGRDGERSAAQSRSQSHSHSHSHSHSQTRAQAQAQAAGAGGGGGGDGDGDGDAAAGSWRGGDQPLVPDSRGPPVTKATASAEVSEGSLVSSAGFEEFSPEVGPTGRIPSFESHCMISSDSGIEMTPGDCIDLTKILADPIGSEKTEGQNYIDMCQSGESKPQQVSKMYWEDQMMSFVDNDSYMTTVVQTSPGNEEQIVEGLRLIEDRSPCLSPEEPKTAPYVEEPSDEEASEKLEMGDTQHHVDTTSVPGVLKEVEATVDPNREYKPQYECETKPKRGPELVPTVTVSEPEDDSPNSETPTPSSSEESDSQIESSYHMLEDDCPTAPKPLQLTECFSPTKTPEGSSPSAASEEKALEESEQNSPKFPAAALEQLEASSTESGDSEIEVVPDESLAGEEADSCGYMSFRQVDSSLPSSVSSVQYSILREEREAELDSELIIDYDASSVSEESLQREQGSLMKPEAAGKPPGEKTSAAKHQGEPDHQPSRSAEYLKGADKSPVPLNYSAAFVTPEVVVQAPSPEENAEETARKVSEAKTLDAGKDMGSSQPVAPERLLRLLSKQTAIDLLYWRDIKQTGIVFGSVLLLLFSLTQFSVVSVIAYLALAALSATISFRIYKSVLQAVQKTDEGHPFKAYLDMDTNLSEEQIQKYADSALVYVNSTVKELRRLFLVHDLVDSLKFAVLMWLLTYVGALFNGLTLLIMAVVSMFTLPVVYEKYQAQIDQYLGLVRTHVNSVVGKIQAKIPGAKRKTE
uniref:Reticulon n=1 Tax=Callorhinchus milii TaxID=7868 RepID=A0A4W3H9G4_CALMI|eukprot:gi/632971118/ref/XP_007902015.1/ PREDICTED: reticulon-1 isoform X2 [Callorhinchus milii]